MINLFPNLTQDEEFQILRDKGHTGSLNDMQYEYLTDLGFTGSLADMSKSKEDNTVASDLSAFNPTGQFSFQGEAIVAQTDGSGTQSLGTSIDLEAGEDYVFDFLFSDGVPAASSFQFRVDGVQYNLSPSTGQSLQVELLSATTPIIYNTTIRGSAIAGLTFKVDNILVFKKPS